MPNYVREFVIADIADVHDLFIRNVKVYEEVERRYAALGQPGMGAATVRLMLRAYADFNRNLDQVAADTAADAKRRILSILALRQKRPNTGMGPHLRGAIVCRPLKLGIGTGAVGIADVDRLNAVTNPFGPQYGPYWRAIEEGTRRHVGRRITGAFFGTGLGSGPFRPNPGDFRRHPIFVTSAQGAREFADAGFSGGFGPKGGKSGGRMRIRRAIDPQHFIRDGAKLAEIRWRREIARVQAQAMREIAAATQVRP